MGEVMLSVLAEIKSSRNLTKLYEVTLIAIEYAHNTFESVVNRYPHITIISNLSFTIDTSIFSANQVSKLAVRLSDELANSDPNYEVDLDDNFETITVSYNTNEVAIEWGRP